MTTEVCEYQENLELMREIKYFSALSIEVQKLIAYLCVRESFAPDQIVFNSGEIDDTAYFVISGKLRASIPDKEENILNYKRGDFVGALSLIGNSKRLFTLKATTETLCLCITKDKFMKIKQQFPEISNKFLKIIVDKIINNEELIIENYDPSCKSCNKFLGLSLV